jgi:hypothetical protein
MSLTRSSLAALVAAQAAIGVALTRAPVSTPDALTLAEELEPAEIRHAELLPPAVAELKAALALPVLEEIDLEVERVKRQADAIAAFWNAFEGQVVDGVEIIRRRT